MSKLVINTGTTPNDGTGDSLFAGAGKINSNFSEIYSFIGDGTTLGIASFSQITVSGASTFAGITTVTGVSLFAKQLSVSGVSTFAGITTVTGVTLFSKQINVSGVSTLPTVSGTNATYTTGNFTTGNIVTGVVTNISGTNLNYTGIATAGSVNIGATQVISSGRQLQNIASLDATTTATIETAIANAPNTFADINVSGISTFAGITTVTGVSLFSKQLSVSGVSTFAGITVTGTTFTNQLNVSGVATITGNLNAAGNYYVKLGRLTDQTVTTGVDTLIGFTATSDSNGWYSGITTRTTPTVAGTYRVDAMINWQAGTVTNNQSNIQLRKNGTTVALHQVGVTTFSYSQTVCGIVTMNGTTDYIDFTVYTSNPTSQTVRGTADGAWTKMEIFKIN